MAMESMGMVKAYFNRGKVLIAWLFRVRESLLCCSARFTGWASKMRSIPEVCRIVVLPAPRVLQGERVAARRRGQHVQVADRGVAPGVRDDQAVDRIPHRERDGRGGVVRKRRHIRRRLRTQRYAADDRRHAFALQSLPAFQRQPGRAGLPPVFDPLAMRVFGWVRVFGCVLGVRGEERSLAAAGA
jgi:hypothetical protein